MALPAIESSPVGQAIQNFMNIHETWSGTMASLLTQLKLQVEESVARSKFFPQDAIRLAKHLTRLSPDLKAIGIEIDTRKSNGVKIICLVKRANLSTLTTLLDSLKSSKLDTERVVVRVDDTESIDPDQKFIDPIDPVRKSIDPAINPAINSFIERVSEIQDDNRVDRVNKKRAILPHAKTDLGEWEFTDEIGEYEYITDDE